MTDRITDWVYSHKDRLLDVLRELIAIPSVMGTPSEDAPFGTEPKRALLKMEEICQKLGFTTKNVGNAVLCVDYLPDGSEPELGILAHLDVVPVEPQNWEQDPFEMVERNGVLYGRGTIDDKGPAVAALFSLLCVKELGFPITKGVRLIFGTNEENGSDDLEIYKKQEKFPPKVFTPDGSFPIINIEKGMMRSRFSGNLGECEVVEFHGGKIPNAVPDRAQTVLRGISYETVLDAIEKNGNQAEFDAYEVTDGVKIVCKGRSAHASTPENGVNAVVGLISLVNRICAIPCFQALEKLFPFGETDGNAIGMKCSDESGSLTCVFSIFDVADGKASGTVDVRFPTYRTLAQTECLEREAFTREGLTFGDYMGDEPHVVSEKDEFVQSLLRVYEQVEGEKGYCVAIGGGTYVHDISGGVAFGAERGDTDYHMHGDNEFITVDELLRDCVLYAAAICDVCS